MKNPNAKLHFELHKFLNQNLKKKIQKAKYGVDKILPLLRYSIKGTGHHFIFQISLFSTLTDIFVYLETPPMH